MNNRTQPACCSQVYQIKRSELPLSCPTREMQLWNAHPQVYLPIEASGEVKCPYCGAIYKLIEE